LQSVTTILAAIPSIEKLSGLLHEVLRSPLRAGGLELLGSDHPQHGALQHKSANPKVVGWDGAVRSYVDYLNELATIN
jgi:hypothetical protein